MTFIISVIGLQGGIDSFMPFWCLGSFVYKVCKIGMIFSMGFNQGENAVNEKLSFLKKYVLGRGNNE